MPIAVDECAEWLHPPSGIIYEMSREELPGDPEAYVLMDGSDAARLAYIEANLRNVPQLFGHPTHLQELLDRYARDVEFLLGVAKRPRRWS